MEGARSLFLPEPDCDALEVEPGASNFFARREMVPAVNKIKGGNSICCRRWFHMEYRGKQITILQGVGPGSWKWRVQLDEHATKSGEAPSRAAAMNSAVW